MANASGSSSGVTKTPRVPERREGHWGPSQMMEANFEVFYTEYHFPRGACFLLLFENETPYTNGDLGEICFFEAPLKSGKRCYEPYFGGAGPCRYLTSEERDRVDAVTGIGSMDWSVMGLGGTLSPVTTPTSDMSETPIVNSSEASGEDMPNAPSGTQNTILLSNSNSSSRSNLPKVGIDLGAHSGMFPPSGVLSAIPSSAEVPFLELPSVFRVTIVGGLDTSMPVLVGVPSTQAVHVGGGFEVPPNLSARGKGQAVSPTTSDNLGESDTELPASPAWHSRPYA
ncbi:hypothetical protein CJ030_MR5G022566 [Morella rubra]|uniref:Uncharacterized protein n=1 Tax=Morella rubra TaxID=262757 RepID=A0A6A1VI92_9ROSI|nr:hypothetical protein CJ030_MR5G022566 [Morella rubra]